MLQAYLPQHLSGACFSLRLLDPGEHKGTATFFGDRVQKALIQEAIVRPESALVISITLLLAVFAPQIGYLEFIPFWMWLLGGALAEGALIYSSLSDPEFGSKVAAPPGGRR